MMPWDVDAETLGAKTVRFKCQILHSKLVDLIVAPQHILIRIMTGGTEGADGIAVAVADLGLGTFLGAGIPLLESSL